MEFDIEKNNMLGIIENQIKDNARIRVIGAIDSNKVYHLFDEQKAKELFPPKGYIFEPGFFLNNRWKIGELIQFKVKDNEKSIPDGDMFRMHTDNNNKPKSYGIRVFCIKNLSITPTSIDFSQTRLENSDENYLNSFFIIFKDRIYGKLKLENEKIVPVEGHFVRSWNIVECSYYEYLNYRYLLHEPAPNDSLFDAMNENHLFNWFKKKLNQHNSNKIALDYLNQNIKWQDNFPEILKELTEDKLKLERIRFQRVVNNITQFDLTISDIKELANTSENLRKEYNSALERHMIVLRQENAKEIEEFKIRKEIEKRKLELQLSEVSIEIAHKNKELSDIIEEIKSGNAKIEIINTNKDRILSDFSVIQEVLGNRISTDKAKDQIQDVSFVIESFMPGQNSISIVQRDRFLARLKYFVNQQNINSSMASKLIPIFASCQGIFMQKIELGLAFIEATGNSKFIIQQVEPDWLHFKDLWKNGLGTIWKLSHENPDILHFLILEDINLSSPECYMRPLLDCMNGIRKQIPFAKTAFPNNLRILATKISSDEPKIGLPLYQQTFKNWGAIGFVGDTNKPVEQYNSIVEGYLEAEVFSSFKSDEPIEDYATRLIDEYKILFDIQ